MMRTNSFTGIGSSWQSFSFGQKPDLLLPVSGEQQQIGQMLSDINQLRTQQGLSSLTLDARLCRAARQHAEDMAQYNYFRHRGRKRFLFASGPGTRATASGYQWTAIAENICAGYRNASAAFQSWALSPEHCRNLVDPRYQDAGIGVARVPLKHTGCCF
ncbi:MAG TPA: CAP domain-containing protein [Chthoniobacterales bacterium]|nr:CAP domain-containing protein [Chthoniobacterales bacterium]